MTKRILLAIVVTLVATSHVDAMTPIVYGGQSLYGGWGVTRIYARPRRRSAGFYGYHNGRLHRYRPYYRQGR